MKLTERQKEEVCRNCVFKSNGATCENEDSPYFEMIVGQLTSCEEFTNENEEDE